MPSGRGLGRRASAATPRSARPCIPSNPSIVATSIGSPATTGTGIVILAMVLEGVGIPVAGVALLLGVDRMLDMSRTVASVTGDLTARVVMNRMTPVVAHAIEAVEGSSVESE